MDTLEWPPRLEQLKNFETNFPVNLSEFLTNLLKSKDRANSEVIKRLVHSYGSDLIHGVTRGKVATLKHFLIGLGLHNITGLKTSIQVLSHLGLSISYDLVCEVETAEAEAAQKWMSESQSPQQNQDPSNRDIVLTYWWFDNFNQKLESQTGAGAIDSIHIVEFSERSHVDPERSAIVNVPRSKRQSLTTSAMNLPRVKVDKKKEPSVVSTPLSEDWRKQMYEKVKDFKKLYKIWMLGRILSSKDQFLPTFSGWCVAIQTGKLGDKEIEKTSLTYLPPVNHPITDFVTIYKVFEIIQNRAKVANSPYANVTLDVGAAINAHKVLWNHEEKFKNIVIHLGDFHFMKECFGAVGSLISGSGFEDIVHQSGLCSTGGLNGVISGSHYNRCWNVHSHLAKALGRLLLERFLQEVDNILEIIASNIDSRKCGESILKELEDNIEVQTFFNAYSTFKQQICNGYHGKTSKFWPVYYLDLIIEIHLLHYSVQSNNFYLRLHGWKKLLPLMFSLNRQNYSRYGSCYVNTLENLESTHPGCRELIQDKGLSVQGQEKYLCRTAIDQHGEQTINRDAKNVWGHKVLCCRS